MRYKIEASKHILKKFQGNSVIPYMSTICFWPACTPQDVPIQVALQIMDIFSTNKPAVAFLHMKEDTFSQYFALLTMADVFFTASPWKSMTLRTHKFVECQKKGHRPLILSGVCFYIVSVADADKCAFAVHGFAIWPSILASPSICMMHVALPTQSIRQACLTYPCTTRPIQIRR